MIEGDGGRALAIPDLPHIALRTGRLGKDQGGPRHLDQHLHAGGVGAGVRVVLGGENDQLVGAAILIDAL